MTPGLRDGLSELSPAVVELVKIRPRAGCRTISGRSSSLTPPRLAEGVYREESPRLDFEQSTSLVAPSTSAIIPGNPEASPGSSGADAQECETISDTLAFMIQYSCPAIG